MPPSSIDATLLSDFAQRYKVRLRTIDFRDVAEAVEAVRDGRADMAAARLQSDMANKVNLVAGPAYEETTLSLFCHHRIKISELNDLSHETIGFLEKDNYRDLDSRLQRFFPHLRVERIVNSSPQELLFLTARRKFDCVVLETLEGLWYQRAFPSVVNVGVISESFSLSWLVSPQNKDLLIALRYWFQKASREDVIARATELPRTFITELKAADVRKFLSAQRAILPAYKHTFISAAKEFDIDWKLLAAIAWQESHWNEEAVSFTGVRGFMQLTQATAEHLGVDRTDPDQAIWGGAWYFRQLYDSTPEWLPHPERVAFALAAWNIGPANLQEGQRLTKEKGLNPWAWTHVRRVLPLMADPSLASELKYGNARGHETINFVSRVKAFWTLL
ncbi:MAG: transglycosylase SLT domain-containing protein [Bdellovibrionaceae bacterium]|nr:transglycosylase SLT domain-containing protein [Pseudobdellovibrionaceae bacterium]